MYGEGSRFVRYGPRVAAVIISPMHVRPAPTASWTGLHPPMNLRQVEVSASACKQAGGTHLSAVVCCSGCGRSRSSFKLQGCCAGRKCLPLPGPHTWNLDFEVQRSSARLGHASQRTIHSKIYSTSACARYPLRCPFGDSQQPLSVPIRLLDSPPRRR